MLGLIGCFFLGGGRRRFAFEVTRLLFCRVVFPPTCVWNMYKMLRPIMFNFTLSHIWSYFFFVSRGYFVVATSSSLLVHSILFFCRAALSVPPPICIWCPWSVVHMAMIRFGLRSWTTSALSWTTEVSWRWVVVKIDSSSSSTGHLYNKNTSKKKKQAGKISRK